MRAIELHELNSIGGGTQQVTIPRQRDDSTARAGTVQLSTSTRGGTSGGGNSGGGGAAGAAAAPKPTVTTTDTVSEVCVPHRITEASFGIAGVSVKMEGGCKTTRTFTTHQSK